MYAYAEAALEIRLRDGETQSMFVFAFKLKAMIAQVFQGRVSKPSDMHKNCKVDDILHELKMFNFKIIDPS